MGVEEWEYEHILRHELKDQKYRGSMRYQRAYNAAHSLLNEGVYPGPKPLAERLGRTRRYSLDAAEVVGRRDALHDHAYAALAGGRFKQDPERAMLHVEARTRASLSARLGELGWMRKENWNLGRMSDALSA